MTQEALGERFYVRPAAAHLRTRLAGDVSVTPEALLARGLEEGVRLQRFKRSTLLPRVQRVLGFLRSVVPSSLLDIGTGRGAFLWPLLEAFPELDVRCVDLLEHRVEMIEDVRAGGVANISAEVSDAMDADWDPGACDVVSALEVLEHMREPQRAIENCVRCARRFVVASVPSKEDRNPEHVQLFGAGELERRFVEAGARKATCEHVLNHRLIFVTL